MSISRRTFLTSSTAGAVLAAMTLPSLAVANQMETPITDASDREERLLSAMEQHGIPGAIVLLDSPETGLWKTALGVANLETGEPMTVDMHMRIGSITKTFSSTMILQLVDQGALAMDDTLATLLPSYRSLPNADTITLRHLLTMQSGLPDFINMSGVLDADPYATKTDHQMISLIETMNAEFSPGENSKYSNTNYILLGMIAREVTGTPWAELVQTGILDQVGLANTMIPTGPELPHPAPRGYDYGMMELTTGAPSATSAPEREPVDMTLSNPFSSGAAGNMISTVDDLHTWMGVLLDGSLLSPTLQDDRMDFSDEGFIGSPIGGMTYGLGLALKDGAVGHDGGIPGFRSVMGYLPERESTVIIMTNVVPTRDGQDPVPILMEAVLGE
jgi:D-alanyl-D-alanine carboxypeptidase